MAARTYLNWKWFFGSLALVLSIGLITATASSDAATKAQTQAGWQLLQRDETGLVVASDTRSPQAQAILLTLSWVTVPPSAIYQHEEEPKPSKLEPNFATATSKLPEFYRVSGVGVWKQQN